MCEGGWVGDRIGGKWEGSSVCVEEGGLGFSVCTEDFTFFHSLLITRLMSQKFD